MESRREVLRAFAVLVGATLSAKVLAACASAEDHPGATKDNPDVAEEDLAAAGAEPEGALRACNADAPAVIMANHGHMLTVPKPDVLAGAPKSYSIQGTAGHDHVVSLSSAQMAKLKKGSSITVTSTTSLGHLHSVKLRCA